MRSAPNALIVTLLSKLVYDGMVSTILYPFKADMKAMLIPILPDVGSISTVFPGVMSPFFSASSIIAIAGLSLTLAVGCIISCLTAIYAPHPSLILFRKTRGVLPISWETWGLM
uniref:Uncharacterized protein n=1 Tax=Opuntia streptacantha TaxID=393608 RepID=A0A7C9AYQ6_OPUST